MSSGTPCDISYGIYDGNGGNGSGIPVSGNGGAVSETFICRIRTRRGVGAEREERVAKSRNGRLDVEQRVQEGQRPVYRGI